MPTNTSHLDETRSDTFNGDPSNQMQAAVPGTERLGQPHPGPCYYNPSINMQVPSGVQAPFQESYSSRNEQHQQTNQSGTIFSSAPSQDSLIDRTKETPVPYTSDQSSLNIMVSDQRAPIDVSHSNDTGLGTLNGNSFGQMQAPGINPGPLNYTPTPNQSSFDSSTPFRAQEYHNTRDVQTATSGQSIPTPNTIPTNVRDNYMNMNSVVDNMQSDQATYGQSSSPHNAQMDHLDFFQPFPTQMDHLDFFQSFPTQTTQMDYVDFFQSFPAQQMDLPEFSN